MNIPKTLVIGINMHGEIHLQDNGTPKTEYLYENINVKIINAVAPGVPNVSTLENYENLAVNISTKCETIKNWNKLTKNNITEISGSIKNLLVECNQEEAKLIIKEHQNLYSKKQINHNFQKYAHLYGKSFNISEYVPNKKIINKRFVKFTDEEINNFDPDENSETNLEYNYFNKIVIYNLEGEPDIFELFESMGLNVTEITLYELIEFLSNAGAENLIIIDLSCSIFRGNPEYLYERNIRHLRRQIIEEYKM
jgi:hypothetical protein